MNTLSFFLYFIDIVKDLGTVLLTFGIISTITIVVTLGPTLMYYTTYLHEVQMNSGKVGKHESTDYHEFMRWLGWTKRVITVSIVSWVFFVLVPSERTMYMIAASEIGEQITQLEQVKELGGITAEIADSTLKLLRDRIQEELVK